MAVAYIAVVAVAVAVIAGRFRKWESLGLPGRAGWKLREASTWMMCHPSAVKGEARSHNGQFATERGRSELSLQSSPYWIFLVEVVGETVASNYPTRPMLS